MSSLATNVAIFWDVAPCSLVEVHRNVLHLQVARSNQQDVGNPEQLLCYRPLGKRRVGRPFNRHVDGCCREDGTHYLLSWLHDPNKKEKRHGFKFSALVRRYKCELLD
jgi:hypothetical protein